MTQFIITAPNGKKYKVNGPPGSTKEDALKKVQSQLGAAEPTAPDRSGRNWLDIPGEMVENFGTSAVNTAKGIYDMVSHPVDTLRTIDDAATGGLRKLEPEWLKSFDSAITPDWMEPKPETLHRQDQVANATGAALYDRYGSIDNIKNTLATDPVGSGLDVLTIGTGVGGALRGAGVMGRGATALPGQTRTSQAMLRRAAPKSSQELAGLGPDAMLLDSSPSMTGLAQGVATSPTPSRNAIVQALEERQATRVPRLDQDRISALGKARDPDLLKSTISKQAQRKADPFYTRSKANAPDLTGQANILAQKLTSPSNGLKPSGRKIMQNIMDDIDDALMAGDKRLTAERLHDIRKDLDAQIVHDSMDYQALSSADKAAQAPLKQARRAIDDILKDNLPGFREGDRIIAKAKKSEEAVDYGIKSLEGGKYAHTPERFDLELKKRDPKMVGEGMKADIRVAVGTQANDLSALRKKVGGDNDFNRAKIEKVFGKSAVDKLVKAIDREDLFGRNYADITRNSQTANRSMASALVNKSDAPRFSGQETIVGVGLRGTAKMANALVGKIAARSSQPTREALVKALTAKGPEAVKILDALIDSNPKSSAAKAIVRALAMTHVSETVNSGARNYGH